MLFNNDAFRSCAAMPLELLQFPPPPHSAFASVRENGLAESCTKEDGSLQQSPLGSAEAETHSLDRHLFGLTWHRSSTKSHRSRAGTDFDSPGVALLAPSASVSSVQHSAAQLASAPHRFASFLSRRLKRTKSQPKLQNGRELECSRQHTPGRHQLLRASLGPNALRTDQQHQQQQQRGQPLSLYLPCPASAEERLLQASRSFESLLLLGQAGVRLQKSPSESEHKRLLLCPTMSHFQQQTSLESSQYCLDSNGRSWMDSGGSSKSSLRVRMQQQRDERRRQENSLSVWVLEAKGVPPKRRFYCELSLDRVQMAKTSAKAMADGICFWGEHFQFQQLPPSQLLCVDLYREMEPQKRRRGGKSSQEELQNLIGLVRIPVAELSGRQPIEKWYTVTSGDGQQPATAGNGGDSQPSLRLKARYQSVHVLPLRAYGPLREFLRTNCLPLCAAFEPLLGVKAKEDFANSLVRILHAERRAPEALAEMAMAEVLGQENDHLLFRGNSLATKAVEAYMKLVATDYLQMALGDFVRQLLCNECTCEVDPLRLGASPSSAQLERNRQQLLRQVEAAWRCVLGCQDFFPHPLRLLFANLRQRLEQAGRAELADNLLSSSIFLRFLCPAILSPSLFGLVTEYPTGQSARNLTLIAKSLQTLANFTRFGGKEAYMEFMNAFVEREWRNMQQFLRQISAPCPRHCQSGEHQAKAIDSQIDLGKELSLMSGYLRDNWSGQLQEQQPNTMGHLWALLVAIQAWDCADPEEDLEMEDHLDVDSISHGHNPPSDYENNAVNVAAVGSEKSALEERRSQPMPSRRAILPPQPIFSGSFGSANGPSSAPPLPIMPPPPFSPSTAPHLHSSDDYVLSTALAKLRTSQDGSIGIGGPKASSIVHLYDETPNSAAVHLYDQVAGEQLQNGRALHSGIVKAQRGVAQHEAQHRELCTPRVVQRGTSRQGRGVRDDEADDESDTDEGGIGQNSPRGSSSNGSFRQQRRVPRKRSGHRQHQQAANDFVPPSSHQTVGVHFDSSAASGVSNRRPSGTNVGTMAVPSSGYQSQMNSSSYSSNSSSPVDTTESSLLGTVSYSQQANGSMAIANPLCPQTSLAGASSSSSSSAYSSLSPNPQSNGIILPPMKPPTRAAVEQQQIGQNWPSLRERAQTRAVNPMESIQGVAQMNSNWAQQQTPRTSTHQSSWSIPGSSGQIQRQALVGSTPSDPMGAFIRRYPATPMANGPLPQKFPTAAELQHWPSCNGGQQNGTPNGLYSSASIELGLGNGLQQRQEANKLREMELIEVQRRQIAELTRENAVLRRELDTVRAISQCSLPASIEQTASDSI